MKICRFVFFFLLIGLTVRAQQTPLDDLNQSRIKVQTTGMWVLSSWAVANIAYGGIAAARGEGSNKYFNRMNVYWNVVNLGIAAPALIGSLRQRKSPPTSLDQSIEDLHSIEKTLLLNAGLDLAYMTGGLYLLEKAKNTPDKQDRFRGFGQSILLQGGFLLLFDAANYLALRQSHRQAAEILKKVQFTGQSVRVVLTF
ncbi:DUF6992 family protein [Persicitalea jodogahamensis]|uniref:Uncharacterized protein n=1 Tax=Persicitalea jodogahamensis TaxID=402147 RepID=A0A8J3D7F1_9BACT|nr:hypothetical protein [Persicitalea jodogahamensis]GHB85231.1 hypothetical protein GCM10007390_45700 [Persicitalea jodogahamensis]